jgi:hypothetical protein
MSRGAKAAFSLSAARGASTAIFLFPLITAGQPTEPRLAGQPMRSSSLWAETIIMPDAGPVWRKDNRRESREDRNYWMDYRRKLKERLLGAERARTARILTAARARAATGASSAQSDAGGKAEPGTEGTFFPRPPGAEMLSGAATTAKRHLDEAVATARSTTQSIAETIERNIPATKNYATRTASVILDLLTVFLAPAVLLTGVAFGLFKLRKRRR